MAKFITDLTLVNKSDLPGATSFIHGRDPARAAGDRDVRMAIADFAVGGIRETTIVSSATPTPNADTTDILTITALSEAAALGIPTGTPTQGQRLIVRITDDGTAHALTYDAIFRVFHISLPTTTVISQDLYIFVIYNSTAVKWDVVDVFQQDGVFNFSGLVNGRDIATDGAKLDTVEDSATADQSNAEIKTAYEANADTNEFSDAEQTKLGNIEDAADVTDEPNVNAAGATMNADTDVSANGWVLDEDGLSSNSPAKLATQQSIKAYVDALAAGLDPKESVVNATTANISLTGEQTIDGVLTSASRILVKDQSVGSENGIYITAAGAWSRSADADDDIEVTSGLYLHVISGTENGKKGFILTTADPITIDTTSLTFVLFSDATAAPIDTVHGRTGVVVGASGDYDADQIDETASNKIMTATERTKLTAIEADATIDQTDAEIATAYGNEVAAASQAEMEAGTETALRTVSPIRIKQAIDALASGGGVTYPASGFTGDHTLGLDDAGKLFFYVNGGGAKTLTIPANSSVAFPIGTIIRIYNDNNSGTLTISITTDILRLFPIGNQGSRTLVALNEATLMKVDTELWVISGTSGLT